MDEILSHYGHKHGLTGSLLGSGNTHLAVVQSTQDGSDDHAKPEPNPHDNYANDH